MKTVDNNRFVTTVGTFESAEFVVQRHNMRHLMSILRDQLYSDKKLAPIREYSCNAYDANVESGNKDVPIKITLPTTLFPEFKIRDYGKGLTYDEMINIFCSYGESTKRNSNDFIGQLGIGSKSGFAYGDNFLVGSFHNGKKTTYNCVLDKSGVGTLLHLTTEDSTEPSGLEITIPVKNNDLHDFKVKSLKFFKYWNVYPNIVGIDENEINESRKIGELLLNGEGWEIFTRNQYNHSVDTHVIMGNISYPLNWDLVYSFNQRNDRKFNAFYNFLTTNNVLLRMPIGAVEMAPSREALQYTETTINAIKNRVEEIIKSMSIIIQQKIATANNIWDARHIYGKIFGYINDDINASPHAHSYRELEACFKGTLKWNNILIDSVNFQDLHKFDATLGDVSLKHMRPTDPVFHQFEVSRKGIMRSYSYSHAHTLICNPKFHIVVNDVPAKKGINRQAIRWYLNENTKTCRLIYYLNFNNDNVKNEFNKHYHFDTVPTLKLSDIITAYKSCKPKIARAKVPKEMVRMGFGDLSTHRRSTPLNVYETVDLTQTSGVYVYVEDKIVTINNQTVSLINFLDYASELNKSLNLKITKFYIIGPRIKTNKKFDSKNWTNITDLIEKNLKTSNLVNNWIEHTSYINSFTPNDSKKMIVISKSIMQGIAANVTNMNGTFQTLLASYPTIQFANANREINAVRNLGLFNQTTYDKQVNAATARYSNMWSELYNKYKMLKYIDVNFTVIDGKVPIQLAEEIANYINLVDNK